MNQNEQTLQKKIENLERSEIVRSIIEEKGVITRAALRIGITERMMYYKMKKYGINRSNAINS